jgi:TatD DNase family protein
MGEGHARVPHFVDTHCHLDALEFVNDVKEVLERARGTGVRWFVTIGAGRGTESAHDAVAFAHAHPDVVACVGIHPLDAACATDHVLSTIASLASDPEVVGIGETGLDYRLAYVHKDAQRGAFRKQIRLARTVGKPLVIHTRSAAADTLAILREEDARDVGGVLHSFTDDRELAFGVMDLGFALSFSALLLRDDLPQLRAVFRSIPPDRLMIESNAPVLPPPPERNRRCEPGDLPAIADGLAQMLSIDPGELAARTAANAARLFRLKER